MRYTPTMPPMTTSIKLTRRNASVAATKSLQERRQLDVPEPKQRNEPRDVCDERHGQDEQKQTDHASSSLYTKAPMPAATIEAKMMLKPDDSGMNGETPK